MRRAVAGSGDNAQPGPPPAYSEDPSSDFYKMVKQVYDASPTPGSANAAMALYWRDVPGTTTPGHHVSIIKQVLENDKPGLDVAALAYAMGGIMVYDASISTWQTKYNYSLVRPVTYIQNVLVILLVVIVEHTGPSGIYFSSRITFVSQCRSADDSVWR
jgi:hypothetical protein